ncbi:MAG: pitrilysin family protein [Bryobacteraceae bacterium]|nr:pitrilysin family protein [Bryobacteraceae bacterium]
MSRKALALAALLLQAAISLPAQDLAALEKRVTEFTLPNGMHFIVFERHDAPVVAFNAYVNAGSANDPAGKSSIAHMFEHMIGKGIRSVGSKDWAAEEKSLQTVEQIYDKLETAEKSKNTDAIKTLQEQLKDTIESANNHVDPNAYVRTIEEQGGVGFNAGTANDYTVYFYSLPSNKAELWFLMSSEFFRQPVFREFYKERDVVQEERRMRLESNPQGKLVELMLSTAFTKHPYRYYIGPAKEIDELRVKDAEAFFKKNYVPANVTVGIVGDIQPAAAKALAMKYFGDIPKGPAPAALSDIEPPQTKERRAHIAQDSQPLLFIGYKRPDQKDPADPVLDVIAGILSSGRTGMLYKDLVRDRKIALGIQAGATFPSGKYPGLFIFFGLPNAGHTVEEIEKGIYESVEKLKTEKVDAETLQRVKTKVRAGQIRQLDSNSGLAQQLPFYAVNYGDWKYMIKGIDDIDKVTAEDVQRVAKQIFVAEKRTVVWSEQAKAQGGAK